MDTVYLVLDQTPTNTKSNETILAPKKIWTQEMEKDLITLIKEDRGLWDVNNEFYQKRRYRWQAFTKITNKMKVLWPKYEHLFTPLKFIAKFRNFRNYYIRELKKMSSSNVIPRWCHFEDLAFLQNSLVEVKPKFIHPSHGSPIIIQFPDGKRKSLKNVIKKNLKSPNMKSKTKSPTIEDSIYNEEENSETSRETAQSFSDLEEMAIHPPQQQTVQSASNRQHFCNASQKTMTHDEAFANFVAKDLAKIPESQQKEELRFKIVELIHHCKMDTNFLLMDTSLGSLH